MITGLDKYKNKGDILEDLYDKDDRSVTIDEIIREGGEQIIQLQRLTNLIGYKDKNGEYRTDVYDRNGGKITDLEKQKQLKDIILEYIIKKERELL